jgi:hypothetical protein
MRLLLLFLIAVTSAQAKCPPSVEADFRAALTARDETRISSAAASARACLGDPKPEEPERYENPYRLSVQPAGETRQDLIDAYWAGISPMVWWEFPNAPTGDGSLSPLRQPAHVLSGAALALKDDPGNAGRYRRSGELAARFLMQAQAQGGRGVFPTPAWEGGSRDRVRQLTDRFVKKARKDGMLAQVVRNGWIVDDRGAGDLQYDNGLSGEALLAWHAVSPKPEYLAAARAAGDWAMKQPLSTNFNYNGFTAAFLARLGAATGEAAYLNEGIARLRLGVLPGMIADGPYAGHWIDPHNERLVYRLLMIRQMAAVAASSPQADPHRAFIAGRLQIALDAAENQQRAVKKIAHRDTAVKAYCELRGAPEVRSASPDVMALARDAVLLSAKDITPRTDPHAFHCALSMPPPYANPQYPWETTLWPK